MIVLGVQRFALGMRFAGIKESYAVESREQALQLLKDVSADELIIANQSVVDMVPELLNYKNITVIPDSAEELSGMQDLKQIIKSVAGVELEVL